MKSLLLTTSAALALAFAAGQASAQDWNGPYVSGHIGVANSQDDGDERLLFDTDKNGTYGETVRNGAGADAFSPGFCPGSPNGNNAGAGCTDDDNGTDYGLRVGYDWQNGNLVYGIVGEINKADLEDSVTGFSITPAAYHFKREVDGIAALRGRLGYASGDWLVYATAGVAKGDIERSFATTNGANSFTPSGGDDGSGHQIGLGIERKTMGNWSFGVEYLKTSLKDEGYVVAVGPGTAPPTNPFLLVNTGGTNMIRSSDDFENHSLRVTISYRFGAM